MISSFSFHIRCEDYLSPICVYFDKIKVMKELFFRNYY